MVNRLLMFVVRPHASHTRPTVCIVAMYIKQGKSEGYDSCDRPSDLTQIWFKSLIFQPVRPWNLMDNLKQIIGSCSIPHQALCIIWNPSVNSNWSYGPETPNSGQHWQFLSRVTLKFDGWPWKTIGHIFYTTPSVVHYFKAMGELKLQLQSVNAQLTSGQNRRFFVLCDLEIWLMTLENNRAPLLYYIKLCASFQSHGWIQTGVTVRKRSIRVKFDDFLSRVTLKFDRWP